jgi:hypothetical protein
MANDAQLCDVHGCLMQSRSVRVVYGLRRGLKQSPDYLRARREGFPHCNDWVNGGCVVRGLRRQVKTVCPECVAARDALLRGRHAAWLRAHQPECN